MKNLILILALTLFTLASCSDEFQNIESSTDNIEMIDTQVDQLILEDSEYESAIYYDAKDYLRFDFLPNAGFMSELIQSIENDLSQNVIKSCECEDLLVVQDYWIENAGNFIQPFNPQVFSCDNLMARCSSSSEELMEKFINAYSKLLSKQIISSKEYEILQKMFLEIAEGNEINFAKYHRKIANEVNTNTVSKNNEGLVSVVTIKWIREIYTNSTYFTSNSDDQQRLIRFVGGLLPGRLWNGLATAFGHDDPESTQFGIDVWCSITD